MSGDMVDRLEAVGRALYGEEWQRALARELGQVRPAGRSGSREVRQTVLRRWVTRERPTPDWLPVALVALLEDGAIRRRAEAEVLDGMAAKMSAGG